MSTSDTWTGMYPTLHSSNAIWLTVANTGTKCEALTIWSYGSMSEDPIGYSSVSQTPFSASCPYVYIAPTTNSSSSSSSSTSKKDSSPCTTAECNYTALVTPI